MNPQKLSKDQFMAMQGPEALSAMREAVKLGQTIQMAAHEISLNPAYLMLICQERKPKAASSIEAVQQVRAEFDDLAADLKSFAEQWATIRKCVLEETRFLRLAALAADQALADELRNLSGAFDAEKARAKNKRAALIDAGVDAEEAARLAPEPAEEVHGARAAAINDQRAVYEDFSRTLDTSKLPPAVFELAAQIEGTQGIKVGVSQMVDA